MVVIQGAFSDFVLLSNKNKGNKMTSMKHDDRIREDVEINLHMVTGEKSSGLHRRKGTRIRGVVLRFRVAGEVSTRGRDWWRQKLWRSWGCGRFTFRVQTKRVQECKTN